jgi:hypothetical protein
MTVPKLQNLICRKIGENVWLGVKVEDIFSRFKPHLLEYEV